jgi:ADP-heptose:LPS heptosyltransferase
MGSLVLPASGIVHLDANCFIYSVELNLRTPDAIHAATALLNGCELFVTNDSGLSPHF